MREERSGSELFPGTRVIFTYGLAGSASHSFRMRLLLDANLSPVVADSLTKAGYDVRHVGEPGATSLTAQALRPAWLRRAEGE